MLCIGVLLVECLFLGFLVSIGVQKPDDALASFLIMIFSIAYLSYIMSDKKYKGVWKYMALGYFMRLGFLFWDRFCRHIYKLPDSYRDAEGHWADSVLYSHGVEIGRSARKPFGILIRYFGESRLFITFFMILSALVTFIAVLKMLRELDIPEKTVKISMFLLTAMPLYAMHSSFFLMEAYPVMFSALALMYFVRWYKGQGEKNFVYTMIMAFAAAFCHTGIITAAAGYVFIRLVYDPYSGNFHFSWGALILGLAAIAVFAVVFIQFGSLFAEKLGGVKSIKDIDSGVNWDRKANSSYQRYVGNSSSITNIIIYTPIRIVFFLFTPFPLPFMMRKLEDVLAFIGSSLFFMYTYYRAIICIRHKGKFANLAKCILIVGLITAFVFGWGRADVGTNLRHRNKLVAVYVVLLAVSMTEDGRKHRNT